MVCPSILTVKSTIPSIIVIDGTSIILITLREFCEVVLSVNRNEDLHVFDYPLCAVL